MLLKMCAKKSNVKYMKTEGVTKMTLFGSARVSQNKCIFPKQKKFIGASSKK